MSLADITGPLCPRDINPRLTLTVSVRRTHVSSIPRPVSSKTHTSPTMAMDRQQASEPTAIQTRSFGGCDTVGFPRPP